MTTTGKIAKGSALALDKVKAGHRGSLDAAPAPLPALSPCDCYPGLAGDASESMRGLMLSSQSGSLANGEDDMDDWNVVAAEQNEDTGILRLKMATGETLVLRPSLGCCRGLAAYDEDAIEVIGVDRALRESAGRLVLMNTDDFDEIIDELGVGRFFRPRLLRSH